MTKKGERTIVRNEHMAGGEGHVILEQLLTDEQRAPYSRIFSEVTLEPGCSIGYHEHHGEAEAYYLLEGSGLYRDNMLEYPVQAGDVTFCDDGNGHGLKNTGTENMRFIALVLKK